MNQRGRNQGPVNQRNSGPINQRDANQEPMNQRDANQGPINQRGPNQGQTSQRGERYQQTSNQVFLNDQGQYGNSEVGYRDGYGNQGPQGQRSGNAGFSTPPSIFGGPPPLMGQHYVQHVIQPVVMPLYYGHQVPLSQPPPHFPPSYNLHQNNFSNEPYFEPNQQQGYESRHSDYGKGDKRNMQRSSSEQSVDSVGRQSDNYEQGKRGGHRGRGGNSRGRNTRRDNMDNRASAINVNSIGRGKHNDIQSSKNCGCDASEEFDDNVSVVSEISMISLSIADEASYQNLEEKKERREKKSSTSEAYNKSAMVDENEVFKFLVKNLDGQSTPEEIKRKSGLFPAEFHELNWFKKHRRRFLVLGEDDSKCIVVAFYKQATYCKFYITSKSCQKHCGRYHICKDFLLGHCKLAEKCNFSHDFLDERNSKVSKELGFSRVFTSKDICSLMKVRFPHVCQNWVQTGSCSMSDCIGLHLCPRYLLGKCLEGKDCPLLHDKTSPHNKPIIEAYGMSDWQESMFRQMVYISRESTNEGDDHSNDKDKEEAVTGATSDVLYTRVPENSVDNQVPGKKKTEVVNIETSDEASKKYICEDYIIDKCHRPKCQNMHTCTKMPYLWQVKLSGKWRNLQNSEQVEKEFCRYNDRSSDILERHNDENMAIVVYFDKNQKALVKKLTTDDDAVLCDWRRLSTPSFSQGDMNSKGFKTQWRWYFEDDDERWIFFEPDSFQHTLERKFLAKQEVFYFFRENYPFKLKVDFVKMCQVNQKTKKRRVILRRPAFVSSEDVKNGQLGCSLEAAPVVGTKIPKGWVPWDLANPFELVMLDENSPDYKTVADSFYSTLRRTEQKIDSIHRMQNHKLWSLFCNQEKIMKANLRRMGKDCQVDTRYLFHGADSLIDVREMSINNFDVRSSGTTLTMYGDGAYFARDATYCHIDTRPPERFMVVVKVLVGEYTKGDKSYIRPPQKPGSNHQLFDSCVDDESNPSIFVVFDKNQYYPEYLIQYKNVRELFNDEDTFDYVPPVLKPTRRPGSQPLQAQQLTSKSKASSYSNSGDQRISPSSAGVPLASTDSSQPGSSTGSYVSPKQQDPAHPISYPSPSSSSSSASSQQYSTYSTSYLSGKSSYSSDNKK